MAAIIPFQNKRSYTDADVVEGLQRHDRKVEKWFYNTCKEYFDRCFSDLFFDEDSRQEIFQTSFVKLWTEIEDGKITTADDVVCRRGKDGRYQQMTAMLKTFLMTFAKNGFRELLRNTREDNYADVFAVDESLICSVHDDAAERFKTIVIDECIQTLPGNCLEIITLFYYQQKSLDEIMILRNDRNTTKNGLKTAKHKCMTTLRQRVAERLQSDETYE